MAERAVPPEDISPDAFFTRWIPESVAGDEDRRARLADKDLTLVFDLEGEGGGAWTLQIDEGVVRGEAGDHAEPDLRIGLTIETWRELNAGRLSAPEAFVKRRVRLKGNLTLAVRLHLIIG